MAKKSFEEKVETVQQQKQIQVIQLCYQYHVLRAYTEVNIHSNQVNKLLSLMLNI